MRRYTLNNRICSLVMAVLLVLALLMPLVPAVSAAESGSCGRDLEWTFADGTLTITGKGAMDDYESPADAPWYSFREQILRLELPKGLTHVGSRAFYGCSSITAVTVPEKVRTIGDMAFMQCSGMKILRLSEGLESIGENAFEQCASLQDLRLPGTLKTLKDKAFYRCGSLRSVVIPRSVTQMGKGVFSHCEGLIQATVHAPLRRLPSWTFYGCTDLASIDLAEEIKSIGPYSVYDCVCLRVIYYGGEPGDARELEAQIKEDNEYFEQFGSIREENPGESESVGDITIEDDGDATIENTTTTQTENSTITTTTKEEISADGEEEDEAPPTDISATIVTDEGWKELVDAIEDALDNGSVNVDVYLGNGDEVPPDVLNDLAGKDVWMQIITSQGGSYTMDFQNMDRNPGQKKPLDLSYTVTLLEKVRYQALEGVTVYALAFEKSSSFPVSVAIQLPLENVRQMASLYQITGGELELIQSSYVDHRGCALYHLGAVDKGTDYLIAINVSGISGKDTNIPQSLEGDYGVNIQMNNVEYTVTGRKSTWGIGFFEVNRILIGVMLSTAAFVGLGMYALNKRKLRRGYTPGWDDEDEE